MSEPIDYLDHTHTDEVVCPYCGESWRPDRDIYGVERIGCEGCGKVYKVEAEYDVTYSTFKVEEASE